MLSGAFDEDDHHSNLSPEAEEAPPASDGGRPPKLRKTATIVMEENTAIGLLKKAVELRSKYQRAASVTSEALQNAISAGSTVSYCFCSSGLLQLTNAADGAVLFCCGQNVGGFAADYAALFKIVCNGHCRTFCHQRLEMLQQRFDLHETMQGDLEMREMGRGSMASVDFFKVGKVDNHVSQLLPSTQQPLRPHLRTSATPHRTSAIPHPL